jgi:hypothetical protein
MLILFNCEKLILQNLYNICKSRFVHFTSILQKNDIENIVLAENIGKWYKYENGILTNICKPIFLTFGRIGARCAVVQKTLKFLYKRSWSITTVNTICFAASKDHFSGWTSHTRRLWKHECALLAREDWDWRKSIPGWEMTMGTWMSTYYCTYNQYILHRCKLIIVHTIST